VEFAYDDMGRLNGTMVKQYHDENGYSGYLATDYAYTEEGRVSGKHYQMLGKDGDDAVFTEGGWVPFVYSYDENGTLEKIKTEAAASSTRLERLEEKQNETRESVEYIRDIRSLGLHRKAVGRSIL